jgi:nitronate monooxygenase
MLTTRFTDLVGCSVPIQQAGMGAISSPALVAAVSNAGGLGMLGAARWGTQAPAGLEGLLDETTALTDRPFGVNFLLPPHLRPYFDPACFSLAAQRARLVEFFWVWPEAALVEAVHAEGALVSWQVGSVDEAVAAAEVGVDLIIAQGIEAGGHVRGSIGLLPLLDAVLGAVDVPVLAAGGIGSGRPLAAVLAAGADGARLGTRFLVAAEADVHPQYVEALLAAGAEDTVHSHHFVTGWDAPGRVLRASLEAATAFTGEVVGEVPSLDGSRIPLAPFVPEPIPSGASGTIEVMSMWAGESVGSVQQVQPAAVMMQELVQEADRLLERWNAPKTS